MSILCTFCGGITLNNSKTKCLLKYINNIIHIILMTDTIISLMIFKRVVCFYKVNHYTVKVVFPKECIEMARKK